MNQTDKTIGPQPQTTAEPTPGKTTISDSISIKGDISGEDDLVIYGSVEGTINLRNNHILIGDKGSAHANINARHICVEGEVRGELRGTEQVVVKPSGQVIGDVSAPRVVLEDGCEFKGSIDMDDRGKSSSDLISVGSKNQAKKPLSKRLPLTSATNTRRR